MSDNSKDVHRQKKVEPKVFPRSQGNKLHEAGGSSQINARVVSSVGGRVRPGENIGRDFSRRRENDSTPSLASGSKNSGNMFVMSKGRQEMWDRIKKKKMVPVQPGYAAPMQDYKPKGKTCRKAHNDPKEVDEVRANQILERRQRNDTKPGKILSHC